MGSRTFQTYLNFGHQGFCRQWHTDNSCRLSVIEPEKMVRVVWAPPVGQGERFLACEWVLRLFLLFFQRFNRQEGLWSPSGCKHHPRQPMELVHGSQPPAWFPSQASCQEGCRGSRSEERILNHIYMCMMQKGKGRGGREPLRNPKRKSVSTPQYKK